MLIIIALVVLAAISFLPQYWARRTFRRYSTEIPSLPGSGGELIEHLLKTHNMQHISLELTEQGDHYDPVSKTIRLSKNNYYGKSLTAVAVASHEFGHALQDQHHFPLLTLRTRLLHLASAAEKVGSIAMLAMPIITLISKSPVVGGIMLLLGLLSLGMSTLVHLVTLPVETDASFNRAMPILSSGYLQEEQLPAARKILRAAAYTYLAASLASLLNLGRWIAILRGR